jgi:hypothetical protein
MQHGKGAIHIYWEKNALPLWNLCVLSLWWATMVFLFSPPKAKHGLRTDLASQ